MSLAIFDLDKTLLAGDSDHAWGQFLAEQQLVDGDYYKQQNDRFHQAYQAGTLDIYDYLAFALRPLAEHDRPTLDEWHREFMRQKIFPMITPAARKLVEKHRTVGHTLVIITSTNDFITGPIAREFGIENLIATQAETVEGCFTGRVSGTPCYRHGKVERLRAWMTGREVTLADSWFYSDSHNDLPLFEIVDHPVAVNPDDKLRQQAKSLGWPIIELHF